VHPRSNSCQRYPAPLHGQRPGPTDPHPLPRPGNAARKRCPCAPNRSRTRLHFPGQHRPRASWPIPLRLFVLRSWCANLPGRSPTGKGVRITRVHSMAATCSVSAATCTTPLQEWAWAWKIRTCQRTKARPNTQHHGHANHYTPPPLSHLYLAGHGPRRHFRCIPAPRSLLPGLIRSMPCLTIALPTCPGWTLPRFASSACS